MSRQLQTAPPDAGRNVVAINSRRPAGRFDPSRQAKTLVSTLERLRRDGTCREVENTIGEITSIAALTHGAGNAELSALLYTEVAHTLHALGRLDDADETLRAAVKPGDFIGETMHDITRMRARIALDRGQLDEAVVQIRRADRPVLVRSATIVHEMVEGRAWATRRDDSEAGEQVRENEGTVTIATHLLEAEIMMCSGEQAAATAALARVHEALFRAEVRLRDVDDMAMLALLRTLAHDVPHAGSADVLNALAEDWRARKASAPVLARMLAAAGRPQNGLEGQAVNAYEFERYARLGTLARLQRASSAAERHEPELREEASTPAAASPSQAATAASPAESDAYLLETTSPQTEEPADGQQAPFDFSTITSDDIDDLFQTLPAPAPEPAFDATPAAPAAADDSTPQAAPQAAPAVAPEPAAPPQPAVIPTVQIGPEALDLYSVINSLENNRRTGRARFEQSGLSASLYFLQGRIAYAEHGEAATPFEAFKQICLWCDSTEERISVLFTVTESVEAPLTLLNEFHSNAHLIIAGVTGEEDMTERPETTEPPAPPLNEFRDAPPSAATLNSLSAPPSLVVTALDSVLKSRTMQEAVTRLVEQTQEFGARGARAQVLVGDGATVLACYPAQPEENPPSRTPLVEALSGTPANLRVTIEAAEPPPDDMLPALSVMARAARSACETLPARERSRLAQPAADEAGSKFVWASPAMFDTASVIMQLAPMDGITHPTASVLITGETGTGKDMIARYIHERSGRRDREMITVNCAAIPKELFESTVFGYRKGAFTGAQEDTPGLLENAEGSTIFFNEFAEVPPETQAKLLTVLDPEGQYSRVGEAHKLRRANVRFILATNRDVRDVEIMRSDIYNRCPGKIHLKPLRERREDITALAAHFAAEFGLTLTDAALGFLQELEWPGNIRELRTTLQMATGKTDGPLTADDVRAAWLRAYPRTESLIDRPVDHTLALLDEGQTLKQILDEFEYRLLKGAYDRCGGVLQEVIKNSGMAPNTIRTRLEKCGILKKRGYGKKGKDDAREEATAE